ncbi:MAG TPA: FAD-dependent oxidoreductase [Streptosporangiaceae bacterium]|nr:FAD-dependent oxidoreductase [Streptosporangiaceae bacterium]
MTSRTVAVVGAGIIGCLIASELAAADPDTQVIVLDRDLVGSGVSRRSAGVSLPQGSTPRKRGLSAFSHRYYADLRTRHPALPCRPVGARLVLEGATDPADVGYLPDETAPVRADSQAPAGALAAEIKIPSPAQVWRLAGCHYTDVYALIQLLTAAARSRVHFIEGAKVTGLTTGTGAVRLSCASGDELTADQVVIAPGPWLAAPAWRDLVSPLGLRVKKIVAMHLERQPDPADELIIFEQEDAFLLPLAQRGHWLFSYTRLEWDVDPDELAAGPGLSAADVEAARACLRRYSPALADAMVAGRVCCDAYSPAGEPVVSGLDEAGRIVFAGGASGSGYRLAPGIAAETVALLRDRPSPIYSEGATDDHQRV